MPFKRGHGTYMAVEFTFTFQKWNTSLEFSNENMVREYVKNVCYITIIHGNLWYTKKPNVYVHVAGTMFIIYTLRNRCGTFPNNV